LEFWRDSSAFDGFQELFLVPALFAGRLASAIMSDLISNWRRYLPDVTTTGIEIVLAFAISAVIGGHDHCLGDSRPPRDKHIR